MRGFDVQGRPVWRAKFPLERYYDGSVAVLDDSQLRKRKRLATLRGAIFGAQGSLLQVFECTYGRDGRLRSAWAQHSDGTYTQ
jgi:hypothetical protein